MEPILISKQSQFEYETNVYWDREAAGIGVLTQRK